MRIHPPFLDDSCQDTLRALFLTYVKRQIHFQTKWDDSALFYASGEIDGTLHYVAASIINGSVYVELDFGHNSKISTMLGDYVTSDHWNNLTIFHNGSLVFVSLDEEVKVLEVPGENYNMIIDPEIYIGGGPELHKKKGLLSHNNFAGSCETERSNRTNPHPTQDAIVH